MSSPIVSRRDMLIAGAGMTFAGLTASRGPADEHAAEAASALRGKAEHCIMLWLGGGVGQIDTWDPKRKGDPQKRVPGAYYDSIPTAIADTQVCQHLHRCAPLMDRFALLRSVHHDVIDEHAAAVNRMHTGRPSSGTIIYPSIGSIVAHEKSSGGEGVPQYVVIGYPNLTRGPGFLGARYGYLYLTDTQAGPAALQRPDFVDQQRHQQRQALLTQLRHEYVGRYGHEQAIADYDATIEQAERLAGPEFMNVFQLQREPAALRESYGGEFGQRCLLARRLVQSGVRFVEVAHNLNFVNGTGWDVHNEGIRNQHLLIEELDKALSTLVRDLQRHQLLDKTLILVSTEFGRPPQFDGRGGRGHQSHAFSVALAGGGLRLGQVIGQTDELAEQIVERPVTVPELFATVLATLGINPAAELFAGDRPVPLTDMGQPIRELFWA